MGGNQEYDAKGWYDKIYGSVEGQVKGRGMPTLMSQSLANSRGKGLAMGIVYMEISRSWGPWEGEWAKRI